MTTRPKPHIDAKLKSVKTTIRHMPRTLIVEDQCNPCQVQLQYFNFKVQKFNFIIGSASYIVREVRSVRERERERERERDTETDGSDVTNVALKLVMSLHFPLPKIRTIGDEFTLSLAKNSHFSFLPSHFPSLPRLLINFQKSKTHAITDTYRISLSVFLSLSLSLSLSLFSLSLSLSLSLTHRAHLTHNIGSASALPIIQRNCRNKE